MPITSEVIVLNQTTGRLGNFPAIWSLAVTTNSAAHSAVAPAIMDFGSVLRDWRNHRRISQLSLSTQTGISQRHISFLETGRSQPSRATVLALSDSLDIPLRERNVLLHSAGYSAAPISQRSLLTRSLFPSSARIPIRLRLIVLTGLQV